MRINVYAEEITGETTVVIKSPDNHPGVNFYGIRMYLDSPSVLHLTDDDDDRSAITLWVPWTKDSGHQWGKLRELLDNLSDELLSAEEGEHERHGTPLFKE
jgi:hypothetical protein